MKERFKNGMKVIWFVFVLMGIAFNLNLHAETSNEVTIRLLDSYGNGITGGSASYYSGGWKSIVARQYSIRAEIG